MWPAFPSSEYYGLSDFLPVVYRILVLPLNFQYFLLKNWQDLPRSHCYSDCMPCSNDPEGARQRYPLHET
jgi:hypothetical protein